jgi:ATP-dependent protease ClpP protease subunit
MPIDKNTVEMVHEYWMDNKTYEIWIQDEDSSCNGGNGESGITNTSAIRVIKNLNMLKGYMSNGNLARVHLYSIGGSVEDGLAIYDTIMSMPYKVVMYCYAYVPSMASVVLQAADERILMPSAYLMLHHGEINVGEGSQAAYATVDFCKKLDSKILDIYANRAVRGPKFKGKSVSFVRKKFDEAMNSKGNLYLSPEEAIEWGLADSIVKGKSL